MHGKRRCRNHGGCSTGPGARFDWRPAVAAMVAGRRAYIERRHSLGLKAPGGRKSGRWWRRPVSDADKALKLIDDQLDHLAPGPADRPVETWTDAELLGDFGRQGLLKARAIVMQPVKLKQHVDDELSATDIRLQRVIGELGLAGGRLAVRAQEAAWRARQPDGWAELLARVEAAKQRDAVLDDKLIEAVPVETAKG
jgi:hypothetical protein